MLPGAKMGIEIERKFLVDHNQWAKVDKPQGTHYKQGYILADPDRTVRIRISDKSAFLNLKSKNSQLSRNEYEYPCRMARRYYIRLLKTVQRKYVM
jgi:CYTH domain-containing protein